MQIQSGFKSGSTHEIMNSGTHTSGSVPGHCPRLSRLWKALLGQLSAWFLGSIRLSGANSVGDAKPRRTLNPLSITKMVSGKAQQGGVLVPGNGSKLRITWHSQEALGPSDPPPPNPPLSLVSHCCVVVVLIHLRCRTDKTPAQYLSFLSYKAGLVQKCYNQLG